MTEINFLTTFAYRSLGSKAISIYPEDGYQIILKIILMMKCMTHFECFIFQLAS